MVHQAAGDDDGPGTVLDRGPGIERVAVDELAIECLGCCKLTRRRREDGIEVDAEQLDSRAECPRLREPAHHIPEAAADVDHAHRLRGPFPSQPLHDRSDVVCHPSPEQELLSKAQQLAVHPQGQRVDGRRVEHAAGCRQPSHDPRRSALTEPGQPTRHLVTRHVLPVARAVERPEQVGDLHSGGCHQNNVVRAGPGRGQVCATFRPDRRGRAGWAANLCDLPTGSGSRCRLGRRICATLRPDRGPGAGGERICATFRPDPVPSSPAGSYLRSRQTRSNGSLQACGATSWWMAFGPQVPCA